MRKEKRKKFYCLFLLKDVWCICVYVFLNRVLFIYKVSLLLKLSLMEFWSISQKKLVNISYALWFMFSYNNMVKFRLFYKIF